jgi:two-component system chemotaxis family response regulator WspR
MSGLSHRYETIVLLVDDQETVHEAIRRALEDQPDIDLRSCRDAFEALALSQKIGPTVILQDLAMRRREGLALIRKYRANEATKDVPLMVLSSKDDPEIKSEAFALGADDYLVKLPPASELVSRIRRHSRSYLNQLQRDEAYRALRESQQLLVEKNLELERLMKLDGLTGLSNRRYFEEFMAVQWGRAIREQTPFSILMIDVDDFKRYNDTYGHLAGDEVLKKVAETIKSHCMRPTDLAVRFGGEEFVVCLPAEPIDRADVLAERIRAAVETGAIPHLGSRVAPTVTVSIGVASTTPHHGETYLTLIQAADEAMYAAKRAGKNRVEQGQAALVDDRPYEGATIL